MAFKKIILSLVALLLLSTSYFPTSWNCPRFVPSPCGLMTNLTLIAGSAVMLKSTVTQLLIPDTEVSVIMDDGTTVRGYLTAKACEGRTVKTGDQVRLNCTKSFTLESDKTTKHCSLDFLRIDPGSSSCAPGSPCYGVIPSWGISVNEKGVPDPELLKLIIE